MAQMDGWMREFEDAVRLSDDIAGRLADRESNSAVLRPSEASRLISLIRRKLTMLSTKLDSLFSLLSNPSLTKSLTDRELSKRQDMVSNLRAKMNQMSSSLKSSQDSDRSSLLGQNGMQAELKEHNMTVGLSNSGIVGFQRQIMRDQDRDLDKLEETIQSTRHIALAVNEELDLHARLLDGLDEDVDITSNRIKVVRRRVEFLFKHTSNNCCSLVLMVLALVFLFMVIVGIVKYL